jgi:actin-like ATPase involved in cell morphogenesis
MELLCGLAASLGRALLEHSSLDVKAGEPMEVMLGVPANANSNQRFLSAEAFRLAGFSIIGVLNEPSAASVEFGHRNKNSANAQKLLVYDLGGGTFDASLVEHDETTHSVIASEGISTLGGDDFDHLLAEMALETAGLPLHEMTQSEMFRLLEECRRVKEAIHPNTRKITVDLEGVREGLSEITLSAADFFERGRPLLEETMHAVHDLLRRHDNPDIDVLYITGGGSELPLVARMLREDFGRRVKRSAYTRSATAIGLAIQADVSAGYQLRDRFTRYFGVWREADAGSRIIFDPLFAKGTPLPAASEPSISIQRIYSPVHNIGHFRYLECSHLHGDGQPAGDITIWDEILFPFDPALTEEDNLRLLPVDAAPASAEQQIEELYECGSGGSVAVTITNRTAGYQRVFSLGRWSVKTETVVPIRKRRAGKKS